MNQHSRNYRGESTGRGAGRGGRGRGNGGRYTYNRNTSQSGQQQQHESHQHDNSNQSTSTTSNNATQPAEESHAFDMIGGMHNAAKAPSNYGGWNCDSYVQLKNRLANLRTEENFFLLAHKLNTYYDVDRTTNIV